MRPPRWTVCARGLAAGWLREQPRFHPTPWPGGPARSLLGVLLLGSPAEGLGASVHALLSASRRCRPSVGSYRDGAAQADRGRHLFPRPEPCPQSGCASAALAVPWTAGRVSVALPPGPGLSAASAAGSLLLRPDMVGGTRGCWGCESLVGTGECGCSSDVHFARCFCKKQKQQEAAPHQAGGEQVPPCGQCWGDGRLFRQGHLSPRSRTLEILATLQPVRGAGVTRLFWINRRIWDALEGCVAREMERELLACV